MSKQQQENEALAHRFHMDIFQEGNLEVADEILDSNFVWRNPIIPSELQRGPESVKKIASAAMDAMPDRQITHDETITKGDKVMIRWTMTGTCKKELFGILPSDKPTSIIGFDLFRISNEGKIVEMWQQFSNGKWP
jgi:predicted SnoaL-like aldol condensation-catalyzing enzyme